MNLLEKFVVNMEFLKRNDVYNIKTGGEGGAMFGDKNPFYGRHHNEETKQKLRRPKSEIEKQHMRENHYDCRG